MGKDVPALVEAAPLGQRPELVEGITLELDLGLVAREARAALRGQDKLLTPAAHPHLAVGADRQVALLDLVRIGPIEIGWLSTRNLRSTSILDTVDWDRTRQGGSRASGLR